MSITVKIGAGAIAQAAQNSANDAAQAALDAADSANKLNGTSTTSVLIPAAGNSISLTTQGGKFFTAGTKVLWTADSNPTSYWMQVAVTAYDTTTGALTGTVEASAGAGNTFAAWSGRVTGGVGVAGPSGASGTSRAITADTAAFSNIVLASGLVNGATIGGLIVATGQRALLLGQNTPTENGFYIVVASGAASRDPDLATFDAHCGIMATVSGGTRAGKRYQCVSTPGGTLGTNALDFEEKSQVDSFLQYALDKLKSDVFQIVGRPTDPVSSASSLGNSVILFGLNVRQTGYIDVLKVYANAAGPVRVKLFTSNDTTHVHTQDGSEYVVQCVAGLNTFTGTTLGKLGKVEIVAGQRIGVYANGVVAITTAVADGIGYYQSGSGNVTSFTDSTLNSANRPEISFSLVKVDAQPTRLRDIEEYARTLTGEGEGLPQVIGRPTDPISGTVLGGNATVVMEEKAQFDGRLKKVKGYAQAAGWFYLKGPFQPDNDDIVQTQVYTDQAFYIASPGLFTLTERDFGFIKVLAGQRMGFYADGVLALIAGPDTDPLGPMSDSGGYRLGGGNVSAISSTNVRTDESQMQIRFELAYSVTKASDLRATVADLSRLNLGALARSRIQTIGVSVLTAGDIVTTDVTFDYTATLVSAGLLKVIRCRSSGDGYLIVRRIKTPGADATERLEAHHLHQGADLILTLVTGDNEFSADDGDFDPIMFDAGDEVGWYSAGTTLEVDSTLTSLGGGFRSLTGNLPDFQRFPVTYDNPSMPIIGFDFEVYETASVNPTPVNPGEPLHSADKVMAAPGERTIICSLGQSLALGARGVDYLPATRYPDSVLMFGQGIRAATESSFAGFFQGDGTSTEVSAEENQVLNEDVSGLWGTTGFVALADEMVELAAIDSGLSPDDNLLFLCTGAKGGAPIATIDHNSKWRRVLVDNFIAAKERADDAGQTIAAVFMPFREGQEDAIENDVAHADLKQAYIDYCIGVRQLAATHLGQAAQVHFLGMQPSSYITGTAGLGDRDGFIQQMLLDMEQQLSNFHVLGPEFWCDGYAVDDVHLTAYGYEMLGIRDAMAAHEILRLGISPRRIKPLGAWWNGSTVKWRMWSVDPLEYDTTLVANRSDKGFGVKVNGTLATLTGDPVINNAPTGARNAYIRELTFTLDSAPSSGDVVEARMGLDYVGAGLALRDAGAVHNLCTSYTRTVTLNAVSKTIRHWAPHAKRTAIELAAAP